MFAWQQEFRPATAGTIDRVVLTCSGPIASQVRVRIRQLSPLGPGAVLCEQRVAKQSSGTEELVINFASSAIPVTQGMPCLLEVSAGTGTGLSIAGSYVEPPNRPLYQFPLSYAGVPFSNGGWRIGFDLFINSGRCLADINSDGGIDEGDLSAFFRFWESGSSIADVNHDGGVDFDDASVFLDLWSSAAC